MSSKYRILRKPFQQAPPSSFQREQVEKDLCGDTSGFVMLQTSARYCGEPPSSLTYTLPEKEKLYNPNTCHSYILDHYTNHAAFQPLYYELVITYETPEGPREEILKIKPDQAYQTKKFVPTLLFTFYPYDVNNPNDNSYYTYSFSTTSLQWAVEGLDSNGFSTTDMSPDANEGRWIIYNSSEEDPMIPSDLVYNRYYVFNRQNYNYSFHIRTVIEPSAQLDPPMQVYSNVIHLLPVYYNPKYSLPLRLFNEVRERTLPPPYP